MARGIRGAALAGLAAALLALGALPARAQFEADSDAPIEITADSMEWQQGERIAIARGAADAVQGRYRLQADVLTAHIRENSEGATNQISRIDAEGNVRLSTPRETAHGIRGTYDVDAGVVVLVGEVVLTQGDNVMRGERLTMDLESGRSVLDSGAVAESGGPETRPAGGGRVKAIFVPGDSGEAGEAGDAGDSGDSEGAGAAQ